ncbi:sulfatase-like hydrolase/transferase [Variovorax sp. 160MFSha2.1]|uniref:sulfatase-like hydrolase/transferase n=1 Tax=Variovorax sp. 160MFSha2.1 TaxID=3158367 RepID=UPI003AAB95B6
MIKQQRSWSVAFRRLGVALGASALLPSAFLAGYIWIFGAPESAITPHLWVVASLVSALAGLRLAIGLLPLPQAARLTISSLLIACTGLAMVLFYGLVFVGLKHWKRVTTFDMAGSYALQAPDLLRALGYSPLLVTALCASLFALAWYTAYVFLRKGDWVTSFYRNISRSVIGVMAIGLLAISTVSAMALPDRDWGGVGEPLSLSLFPLQSQRAMQSHAIDVFHAAQIDRDEDTVRSAYRPNERARHSNVIVIVADALRADHLSLFGYHRKTSPNLETLNQAGRMRLATSAITVCNESSCGLRALASSHYVDRQAARPITLHEVLKQHGYQVHLIFSGDHTNFDGLSGIYGKVDSYFDGASQSKLYLNDDRLVTDRLQDFGPWDGKPTMFQFHLMSSHALGKRFDDTPEFGPGENYTAVRWGSGDAQMPQRATNFYDRGILQVDRVIRDILSMLEARGYLQDALVLITGDHGESLGERGLYSHTHSVWEESLRVPFVLLSYGTANADGLRPNPVISQIDIAPTLLRFFDMPIPQSWDGVPLQTSIQSRIVYFQQAQLIGLVDGHTSGKLYKHWIDVQTNKQFTFDLLSDPRETKNVTSEVEQSMQKEWRQLLTNRSAALAPEVRERLERQSSRGSAH